MRKIAGLAGLLMLGAAWLDASQPLSIRVAPLVSYEPADLFVQIYIEAHSDNRAIEVVADSDAFYRSSEMTIAGDRAPRAMRLTFRSLPAGTYAVRAILKGPDGRERASAQSRAHVAETAARLPSRGDVFGLRDGQSVRDRRTFPAVPAT